MIHNEDNLNKYIDYVTERLKQPIPYTDIINGFLKSEEDQMKWDIETIDYYISLIHEIEGIE